MSHFQVESEEKTAHNVAVDMAVFGHEVKKTKKNLKDDN